MTTTQLDCSVCGDPLSSHTEAYCGGCGAPYHLNQRTDLEGKDCGQVWINEEHLGLEFGCNTCLTPAPPPPGLDDILDLDEAAAAAGVASAALLAAAEAGQIRHRKTGGGMHLFQRSDLDVFTRSIGR